MDGLLLRRVTVASVAMVLAACSAGGSMGGSRDGGGNGNLDGGVIGAERDGQARPRDGSAPVRDPFDPDAACGSSVIPTERVPGSLLIVFDRSSSMNQDVRGMEPRFGEPTKWQLSEEAIRGALASVPQELNVGLLLFPTGEGEACDVALSSRVPHVRIGPLSITRPAIESALRPGPNGGVTPIYDALRAGYSYLDTLSTSGQRGLVLVTDGAENCDDGDESARLAQAMQENDRKGYLSFAVGLNNSDNFLSTLAVNGDTRRNATCMASCANRRCGTPADCPGGGGCLFGFCTGEPDCCHYNVGADDFRTQFQSALTEIADRFLDSCVFAVPRGTDPDSFSPDLVNVGVTFDGQPRTVLRRSADETRDSWNYVDSSNSSILIQGPICERLLQQSARVEIVLGCATILI